MDEDGDENFLINEVQMAIGNIAGHEETLNPNEILRAINSLLAGVYYLANVLEVRSKEQKPSQKRSRKVAGRKPVLRKPPKKKSAKKDEPETPKAPAAAVSRIQQGINMAAPSGTLPKLQILPKLPQPTPTSLQAQKRAYAGEALGESSRFP